MKRIVTFAFILTVIAAFAAGGYRLGAGSWPDMAAVLAMIHGHERSEIAADLAVSANAATTERRILYWRHPDGRPEYSATPVKTTDGREYAPVYEDEEPAIPGEKPREPAKAASGDTKAEGGEKKILYYRNPMGLPDTSPVPKKDWMNMDYIPVYEGEEEEDGSSVKVSLDKIQRAGVRSELVEMRKLSQPVRAPAVAKIDERTIRDVVLRADGYIEKLYVAETGKHVKAGEPLFRVYSPDIVRAQVDFRVAKEAAAGRSRAETERDLAGAVQRLENLDVPEGVIEGLRSGKDPMPTKIDWPSPVGGVIIEKKVIEGQRANAGDLLYRIADLGSIWVVADVAEQELGQVKIGDPTTVVFRAFPGERFTGRVTFILHELEMQTRTAKVRIEVANPDQRIRHDMYADVTVDVGQEDGERLAVPRSAVLDTGVRQVVLIDKGEGRFEPRPVKLGMRGDGYVEVLEGLARGDKVVTTANFLIDAESNLKAALKGFGADTPAPAEPAPPTAAPMSEDKNSGNGRADAKPMGATP